jgi:hypothetical protein
LPGRSSQIAAREARRARARRIRERKERAFMGESAERFGWGSGTIPASEGGGKKVAVAE